MIREVRTSVMPANAGIQVGLMGRSEEKDGFRPAPE